MKIFKQIISALMICQLVLPVTVIKAEEKSVWSYYMAGEQEYGDVTDENYYLAVKSRYKGSNSSIPAVVACPDQKNVRPMMYIRPEYEWGEKVSEHLKGRVGFFPDSTASTSTGLSDPVVCFTAPEDGTYSIYADFINAGGNSYRADGNFYGDGGWARFSVLSGGQTEETADNTEKITLPSVPSETEDYTHTEYKKDGLVLSQNDKIFLRVSGGESGEGDNFQAIYKITLNGETEFDLHSVVDNMKYEDLTTQWEDSFAATANPLQGELREDYLKEAKILAGLGIIKEEEIGKYSQDIKITRADFAELVATLRGRRIERTKEASDYFSDVEKKHNPDAIDFLVMSGVVANGDKFYPDRNITYAEALKMIVSFMGYSEIAKVSGGYPDGYMKIAAEKKFTVAKVANDEILSRRNATELIFKALDAEILYLVDVSDTPVYKSEKDRTILSEYFDIYVDDGIVNGINRDTLAAPETLGDEIMIDGIRYGSEYDEIEELLGLSVDFWYRDDEDGITVIYAEATKDNEIFEIDRMNIDLFTFSEIEFYHEGKYIKKKLTDFADVLYNGRAVKFSDDPLNHMNDDGGVRIIDNDGDGRIDVAFIENYKNYIVQKTDPVNREVYVEGETTPISMDEDVWHEFSIVNASGSEIGIEDISQNNVLSVFDTLDGLRRKVIVSNLTLQAESTGVHYDSNDCLYISIDGEDYYIYRGWYEIAKTKLMGRISGTYFLDYRNKITGMQKVQSVIGYLMRVYTSDDGELGYFKIVNSNGETIDYEGASKMKVNGVENLSGFQAVQKLKNEYIDDIAQPITFRIASGKVKELNTKDAPSSVNNKFYVEEYNGYLRYTSHSRNFEGKFFVEDKTLLFDIPSNEKYAEGNRAKVTDVNGFVHWQKYNNLIVVKMDEKSLIADAVFAVDAGSSVSIDNTAPIFIVAKISKILNENDEIRYMVSGYTNGEYRTYITAEENTLKSVRPFVNTELGEFEVEVGDIIRVGVNSAGELLNAEFFFDANRKTMLAPNPYVDYNGAEYVLYTNIYDKREDFILTTKTDLTATGIVLKPSECINFRINRIYVVDFTEKKPVQEGGYSDISTYTAQGSNYSRAIVSQINGRVQDLIIYR